MIIQDAVIAITGGAQGLGKAMALGLARRGANLALIDMNQELLAQTQADCEALGIQARTYLCDVSVESMVESTFKQIIEHFGQLDGLINNAGILRDKSFAKMELADFKLVMDVHLMGSVNCTKAVWDIMREQNYGRIVMTTSSSGMYGNFGQSNYGAAKMAVLGLMNTLVIEGAKNNICVNALAPTAGTRMTEDLMPEEIVKAFAPEAVTAGMLTLCDDEAPNRFILCAGAGGYSSASMFETEGCFIPQTAQTPEAVREHWHELTALENQAALASGAKQGEKFVMKAMAFMKSQQK